MPVGVRTRYRRRPQKNREWEAQYPYPAQPAMSERFTVGRERPHSTGVESRSWTPCPRSQTYRQHSE